VRRIFYNIRKNIIFSYFVLKSRLKKEILSAFYSRDKKIIDFQLKTGIYFADHKWGGR
jgi:hypothetical protein